MNKLLTLTIVVLYSFAAINLYLSTKQLDKCKSRIQVQQSLIDRIVADTINNEALSIYIDDVLVETDEWYNYTH